MKISKLLASAFALTLFFNVSCRNEDSITEELPKGAYENGIIITNEGGFSSPTASAEFLARDYSTKETNIYSKNNNNDVLGNVFQTIGFKDESAYLVMNVPNKVEIVNRYTFKRTGSITEQLDNPRFIAFSGRNTYITNNNFYDVKKLNIYDQSNTFVKSINFERYAEKITASGNYVYVQTDGSKYVSGNELPTGHTISRINPSTNEVDKVITLNDNLIIKDMISDDNYVYVITSDSGNQSYFYKISSMTGIVEQISLSGVAGAQKLAIDQNKIYMLSSAKKVYTLTGNTANELFSITANNIYGFNVIDGNIFIADPTFSSDSKVRIYSPTGTLLQTLTTGVGTNGFYKN